MASQKVTFGYDEHGNPTLFDSTPVNTSRTDELYTECQCENEREGAGAIVWAFALIWTLFAFCAGFLAGRFL